LDSDTWQLRNLAELVPMGDDGTMRATRHWRRFGANGYNGGPILASFLRPVPSEPPPVETPAPVSSSGSGTLIHGQEYV